MAKFRANDNKDYQTEEIDFFSITTGTIGLPLN